jgi:uncharacterized GH25 family protein
MRYLLIYVVALANFSLPLNAHEFWISPKSSSVSLGDKVILDLQVGQMLVGQSYPYLSQKFGRYQITDNDGVHDLLSNEGDIPSAIYDATVPGLNIIAYHALPEQVTYDSLQEFADFLEEEGLGPVVNRHRERGLPDADFTEAYTRNAKALVQVGPAFEADQDLATGMEFELVALRNPYLPVTSVPVKLLWQGVGVPNAHVAVFQRVGRSVERTTYRTNDQGIVDILLRGEGFYMISAVHMEENEESSGAVWHSTWASLSFAIGSEIGE